MAPLPSRHSIHDALREPTLPVSTFVRRCVLSGLRRCMRRTSAWRSAPAWAGDTVALLPMVGRTVVLHVAGRLRILLRVHRGNVNAHAVGAMEALAAMLATHALELAWACNGGGAAFHVFQMLSQSAFREALPAVRANRISWILPRRHFLAVKTQSGTIRYIFAAAWWRSAVAQRRHTQPHTHTHHTHTRRVSE